MNADTFIISLFTTLFTKLYHHSLFKGYLSLFVVWFGECTVSIFASQLHFCGRLKFLATA